MNGCRRLSSTVPSQQGGPLVEVDDPFAVGGHRLAADGASVPSDRPSSIGSSMAIARINTVLPAPEGAHDTKPVTAIEMKRMSGTTSHLRLGLRRPTPRPGWRAVASSECRFRE